MVAAANTARPLTGMVSTVTGADLCLVKPCRAISRGVRDLKDKASYP